MCAGWSNAVSTVRQALEAFTTQTLKGYKFWCLLTYKIRLEIFVLTARPLDKIKFPSEFILKNQSTGKRGADKLKEIIEVYPSGIFCCVKSVV